MIELHLSVREFVFVSTPDRIGLEFSSFEADEPPALVALFREIRLNLVKISSQLKKSVYSSAAVVTIGQAAVVLVTGVQINAGMRYLTLGYDVVTGIAQSLLVLT